MKEKCMYINKYEERKKRIIKYCGSFNGKSINTESNKNEFNKLAKFLHLFIRDSRTISECLFGYDCELASIAFDIKKDNKDVSSIPVNFNKEFTKGMSILNHIIRQFESYPDNIELLGGINNMDKIDRLLGLKTDEEEARIHRERTTIANERIAMFTGLILVTSIISIIISVISLITAICHS